MEEQPNQPIAPLPEHHKRDWLLALVVVLLLAIPVGAAFLRQQETVREQSEEIALLKEAQLPAKQYQSYEDCTQNGGKALATVNGQFSACLGGAAKDSEEYQAFLQYSAQELPRINERKASKTENRVDVDANVPASAELVAFLKQDYTGCENDGADGKGQGYYKVLKELPNRFALLNYGCVEDKSALEGKNHIIAMKLGDGWSLLSPTNNMNDDGVPSCLLVDMFKISRDLTAKCYENTGYNNGRIKDVTHLLN